MSDELLQRITPDVKLGQNVTIYDFVNLYGCEIGDDTKIGTFVEIQKGAPDCWAYCEPSGICEGVTTEDRSLSAIMSCLSTIATRVPRPPRGASRTEEDWQVVPTYVRQRVAIGSGAVILCGVTIGAGAIVGRGMW